jgi:hypothetical protein
MLNWVCVPRVERGRVGLAGRGMPAGFVLVETVIAIGGKLGTVTRGLAGPAPPVRAGARRAEYNPRRAFFNGVVVSVHVGVWERNRNRNSTDVRCTETVIISSPGAPALAGVQPQQPRSE